ncbi:MAG: hypothetical protein P1U74_07205 [Legionellaceae bacterium]|nr:hypothetical protein [Legionellaceae bacterium]
MKIIVDSNIDKIPEDGISIPNNSDFLSSILTNLDYPTNQPPVADLLRKLHSLDGNWHVVSPINWQATHNDGMLVAAGRDFSLTESMGREWFFELKKFVDGEDIKVHYHDACTWLIQINDHPTNTSKPVYSLLNQSIMPELESLDDSLFWQRFITESQMFFNNHPLNKTQGNNLAINGLWVWGGGKMSAKSTKPIIVFDEELLEIANLLSSNVSLYFEQKNLSRTSILLCSFADSLIKSGLDLTKKTTYWYWNNFAYKIKATNWFKQLFK